MVTPLRTRLLKRQVTDLAQKRFVAPAVNRLNDPSVSEAFFLEQTTHRH
jgi:hypothetical protein